MSPPFSDRLTNIKWKEHHHRSNKRSTRSCIRISPWLSFHSSFRFLSLPLWPSILRHLLLSKTLVSVQQREKFLLCPKAHHPLATQNPTGAIYRQRRCPSVPFNTPTLLSNFSFWFFSARPSTELNVDIKVSVGDGEPIESALRRFKREVNKSGHLMELRHRKTFETPQLKKKRKVKEARMRIKFERMQRRRMANRT